MFPHPWFKKRWIWWLAPLVLLGAVKCSHAPYVPPAPVPLAENRDGSLQFIVKDGESSQAVYSADGAKILFLSKKRAHPRNQVYEKDLNSGVEKRLTFQNGSAAHPHYLLKAGWIVYSSSTDELEENSELLHPVHEPSKLPAIYQEPMELYVHALRGFDITRLTEHPGFDGEAQPTNDGNSITFTRVVGQKTQILSLNRQSRSVREIAGLGGNPTQYTVSPDGKWRAWVEWDENFAVAKLRVQKGKEPPLEIAADMIVSKTDLSFSSDSKWLLWAQKDAKSAVFDLWTLEMGTSCPRRLTTSTHGERRDPTLSPDLRWLTFTLRDSDWSRIARMGFVPPAGPCPAAP